MNKDEIIDTLKNAFALAVENPVKSGIIFIIGFIIGLIVAS